MNRLILLLVLALGTGLMWTDGLAGVFFPENHYLLYNVVERPTVTGPIKLTDQFGTSEHTDIILSAFTNPVNKNGEGIYDPRFHQTWWDIRPDPQPERTVAVDNQFGIQTWTVSEGLFLVLPATKNVGTAPPPGVINHYKCYRATGPVVDASFTLDDQFLTNNFSGAEPRLLCNPVAKEIDGVVTDIVDPVTHLACYEITTLAISQSVFVFDQFGERSLDVFVPEVLCVPSLKEIPVQTEESTWGDVKSIYR